MDGRDDTLAAPEDPSVFRADANANSILEDQSADLCPKVELGPPSPEVAHQSVDKPPGPAPWDRPASGLSGRDDLVGQQPRPRLVDRHGGLERHPSHEGTHMRRNEFPQDHVACAHRHASRPDATARMFLQEIPQRWPITDWKGPRLAQKRAEFVELGQKAPVAFRVSL